MKKILSAIFLFTVSIPFVWSQNSETLFSGGHKTWTLDITPQTKKHYLDSVSTVWKKDSIELKFTILKYDSKGTLVKVKGSVNYTIKGSHVSGTFGPDFKKPIEIKVDDRPGVSIKDLK